MGRPYTAELGLLDSTYRTALETDVADLADAIDNLRRFPVYVVGSGGSFSACVLAAQLHEQFARLPACALTPLEFIHLPKPQHAGVLLISAGGRNPDILAAARHAVDNEYDLIVALCATTNSLLASALSVSRNATVLGFVGPSAKDGFLATNSLIQAAVLLARAYGVELPQELPSLLELSKLSSDPTIAKILNAPNVIALADGWCRAAASDLESKWAELGFGTVSVTDVRNFAHGRHVGLSLRREESALVVFSSGPSDFVSRDTIDRLSGVASLIRVDTALEGVAGGIDLLVRVIAITGAVGEYRGTDPGRPKVPAFGRDLYHYSLSRKGRVAPAALEGPEVWIQRKVTPVLWQLASSSTRDAWQTEFDAWRVEVESKRIGAVVLDYDGTLCEANERYGHPARAIGLALTKLLDQGLSVGIATGRGKSVLEALREAIPDRLWSAVVIGMYNGGIIQRLDESPYASRPIHSAIEFAASTLSGSSALAPIADVQVRPTQITVYGRKPVPNGMIRRLIAEALMLGGSHIDVEIHASTHSVDIVPSGVTKLRVVETIARALAERTHGYREVMTIGDQGQLNGNDAAFLARPLGLSVDQVSSVFSSCWNVSPRAARRTDALLGYLGNLLPDNHDGFRWSAPLAMTQVKKATRNRAAATAGRAGST